MMTSQYEEGDPPANNSFERKRRRNSSVDSRNGYARHSGDRNTRRRRSERSPGERGRRTSKMEEDFERRSRSRSRRRSRQNARRSSRSRSMDRAKQGGRTSRSPAQYRQPRAAPPKERSLSPYSKRLALTQAMNSNR
jgi:hypothetical protein